MIHVILHKQIAVSVMMSFFTDLCFLVYFPFSILFIHRRPVLYSAACYWQWTNGRTANPNA